MIYEYPDWVETFQCIAGDCPDTCCAGWEVGVDEDTAQLYRKAPEPFHSRFCSVMRTDETTGGSYFLPAENMRCPFLNEKNLCDIIIGLGPEALSMVCDEYPRYFNEIGDYQQMDMSLSCMEFGRIFFHHGDMVLKRAEDATPGSGGADNEKLLRILDVRDEMIGKIQGGGQPWKQMLMSLACQYADDAESLMEETDETVCRKMCAGEMLDERTRHAFDAASREAERTSGTTWRAFAEDTEPPAFAKKQQADEWFRKLTVYFLFRYTLDAYRDGSLDPEFRLIDRSLRFIGFLCLARVREQKRPMTTEDMIDVAHLFSRQVEHAEEIVAALKQP